MPPRYSILFRYLCASKLNAYGVKVHLGVKSLVGEWLATAIFNIVWCLCVSKLNAYGVKVHLGVKSLVGEWLATAIFNIVWCLCVSKLNAYGC